MFKIISFFFFNKIKNASKVRFLLDDAFFLYKIIRLIFFIKTQRSVSTTDEDRFDFATATVKKVLSKD
jgi:hypothetical protein